MDFGITHHPVFEKSAEKLQPFVHEALTKIEPDYLIHRVYSQLRHQKMNLKLIGLADQVVKDTMYEGLGKVMSYLFERLFMRHHEPMFQDDYDVSSCNGDICETSQSTTYTALKTGETDSESSLSPASVTSIRLPLNAIDRS